MEHPLVPELIVSVMLTGLLFLAALASAHRDKAAGAASPRVPGVRR